MAEKVYTNCTNSGPVSVYVKDGKVTRIRPLVADPKDYEPWVIEAGGKKYSPPKKPTLAPCVHAERRRIHSPERILYPMKRVDFDPDGERNPQNRGKSSLRAHLVGRSGHPGRLRDHAHQGKARRLGDQRHDLLPPQLGHRRLQGGPFRPLPQHDRRYPCPGQSGQLGGLALGCHPLLRVPLAPGHARTLRHARGRSAERGDDRLLV